MNRLPAAVLWDMDGTLIDSEPLWLRVESEMLSRFGLKMSAETQERMVGSGLRDAAEHFRELGVPLAADVIVAEWVRAVKIGIAEGNVEWRPGARELLSSLREAGVPCALVTMSVRSLAELVVGMLPAGSFAAIVPGDEVAHSKPHPESYLRGARTLGVPIEQCLAIEDSPTGLRAAAASGAVAVGVPHLVPLDDAPAHELWPSLAGIDADELARRFSALRSSVPAG